ncbi:TetR/AcrR family transcriptional regulator [Nocardiopsis coralliicola]
MDDVAVDLPPTLTPAARKVLAAASRLFYAEGINAVGMDRVAEEAAVTKKTIYDRFGSKDRLVAAYLAARDRRWRGTLAERLEGCTSPAERVGTAFDTLGGWLGDEARRGCAMVNAGVELTDPAHPGLDVVRAQKEWTRSLFRGCAAEAGLPRPGAAGDLLFILFEGATVAVASAGVPHATDTAKAAALQLFAE